MSDMTQVTAPKSDQLNADDLISGPRSIRITRVEVRPGTEQPVSVHYEGGDGRPYKPCKSMCRIMVAAWGPDAKNYSGRSMMLYRDPAVKWGGMEVGGIRISHMSHIDKTMVLALTAAKGSRKPHTVKTMDFDQSASPLSVLARARAEAIRGLATYQEFFTSLSPSDRRSLVDTGDHDDLKTTAAKADAAADHPDDLEQ